MVNLLAKQWKSFWENRIFYDVKNFTLLYVKLQNSKLTVKTTQIAKKIVNLLIPLLSHRPAYKKGSSILFSVSISRKSVLFY